MVRIGWVCETVQAIKTGGGGGGGGGEGGVREGGVVHKHSGQASRQTTVHLRTKAAPFHHSTVH